jgi:hypothetical protein
MKHIKLFEHFLSESDGYGRDFFFKKKDGKVTNYFFKVEGVEGDFGFVLAIGKLSRNISIDEAENSYGVISVQPMQESVMDDYLSKDGDYRSREDDEFMLETSEFMRFYKIVGECIKDYLQNNPKVTTLYDEIPLNLEIDLNDYKDTVEALIDEWSYDKWGSQEGPAHRTLVYTRRDHE